LFYVSLKIRVGTARARSAVKTHESLIYLECSV
jgi:hypothetical protein